MPPQRRLALLTYASPGYEAQQRAVVQSARRSGFTDLFCWNRPLLEQTEFYARHRQILDQRKGGGYWLWKPYLIARELARLGSGDFLVYTDSGYPWRPLVIRQSLEPLLDWCERENGGLVPGVYIPRHGANRRWTKRECFITMNCDCEPYWGQPQIQATFSVWQKCARAEGFVAEWLAWCEQPTALADSRILPGIIEHPDFVDHRHDQSILTNLALLRGVRCFGRPDELHPDTKYIDNLTDRIADRPRRIFARNLSRRIVNETRKYLQKMRRAVTRATESSTASTAVRRIAVLRPNHRIGNTLLLTPLMQELEARFPEAEVEVVTAGGAARAVFSRYPRVTALHSFPGKSFRHPGKVLRLLARLRKHEYDIAIDPTTRSRAGRFLLRFVRARQRVGYAWGVARQDRILTHAVDPGHAPAHHAEIPVYLVRSAFRAPGAPEIATSTASLPLDIRLSEAERSEGVRQLAAALGTTAADPRPVVGLFAHATGAKCFAPQWWHQLVDALRTQSPSIQLVEFLPDDGHSRLAGGVRGTYTPDLRMLGAKLAATSLFVIADGGILHLADAAGAKVLALFRTTSPAQYGPRRPGSEALAAADEPPEAVAARISALLLESASRHLP